MLDYQDLLDIGLSPDAETLQARLVAAAARLGFGLSGGTHILGRLASGNETVHALGNPPQGFLEASRSLDVGLRDPLLTAMVSAPGCFSYDQQMYARAGAADLWDNQAAFGYRHGIAYAIHEPSHAEVFSFGVDGPDALPDDAMHRLELEGHLMLVAMHAHEAAKRLWTAPPAMDLNALTVDEVVELQWAADAAVTKTTLGLTLVSRPARPEVLRRAAGKLGARTRSQAVLRVIQGGLIKR